MKKNSSLLLCSFISLTLMGCNEVIDSTSSDVFVPSDEVSDSSMSRAGFLVVEEEGYLVIYDKSAMKRYDETTILVANLPERLRLKVEEGMYFVTEEELYAFLGLPTFAS